MARPNQCIYGGRHSQLTLLTSHFSFLLFPPSHKLSGLSLISFPPRFEFNRRRVVRCHDFPSSWVLLLRRFPGISTSNTVFTSLSYSPYLSTSRESSFPRSFAWAVTPAAASLASLTTDDIRISPLTQHFNNLINRLSTLAITTDIDRSPSLIFITLTTVL